ncbi:hypothetical protein OQA88_6012 [Cercophora sp. LCS_1]
MPTVLTTGANRGLGRALVARYLLQPNATVIAANRGISDPSPQSLSSLPQAENIATRPPLRRSFPNRSEILTSKHGITHLDLVIANAGIMRAFPLVKDVTQGQILEHLQVNVFGVVTLYQATRELLAKAQSGGKQPPVSNAAYGSGKAMLNWFGVRMNAEEERIVAAVLDPAFVQTESKNRDCILCSILSFLAMARKPSSYRSVSWIEASSRPRKLVALADESIVWSLTNWSARQFGMEEAPLTVDQSVDGMANVLGEVGKERHGGRAVLWTGDVQDW